MQRYRPDHFKPEIPPGFFSRGDYLKLTGLSLSNYQTLAKFGRLPMMPPPPDAPKFLLQEEGHPVADADLEWFDLRGWNPISALAFIVSDMFVAEHTCTRDYASALARGINFVHKRWPQIAQTADKVIASGHSRPRHILYAAVIGRRDSPSPVQIVVGTLAEIAEGRGSRQVAKDPCNMIAVSLTDAAVTLRQRAIAHDVNIDGFWAAGI